MFFYRWSWTEFAYLVIKKRVPIVWVFPNNSTYITVYIVYGKVKLFEVYFAVLTDPVNIYVFHSSLSLSSFLFCFQSQSLTAQTLACFSQDAHLPL